MQCPECGNTMIPQGGCHVCLSCGYSPCHNSIRESDRQSPHTSMLRLANTLSKNQESFYESD